MKNHTQLLSFLLISTLIIYNFISSVNKRYNFYIIVYIFYFL